MEAGRRMGSYNSEHAENEAARSRPSLAPDAKMLTDCSIIAAANTVDAFEAALAAPTRAIYLLTGNPLNLPQMVARAREREKLCLVNIDFLDGLSRDRHAVEFLAAQYVAGIISTRFDSLKVARGLGLLTVQRTFAIDSAAVMAAVKSMSQFVPDAIEILPAMAAPKAARRIHEHHPGLPIIGGGLIESVREIEEILKAGVTSVSVSNERLWLI